MTGKSRAWGPQQRQLLADRPAQCEGNFTKIVQRLPIRISIDPDQPAAQLLRVGMFLQPGVDYGGEPPVLMVSARPAHAASE